MVKPIPSRISDSGAGNDALDWRSMLEVVRHSRDRGENCWKTLALYQAVIRTTPPSPDAYSEAGAFASALCDAFDALTDMRETYRAEPHFASAYFPQFAADFRLAGTTRSFALNCHASAAAREPHRFEWQLALGDVLERAGRREEAAQPYRRAARLNPEDPEPRLRLAQVLASTGANKIANSSALVDELPVYADSLDVSPRVRWLPSWRAAALRRARELCARGEVLAGLERYFFISSPSPFPDFTKMRALGDGTAPHASLGYRLREAIGLWIPPALFPFARRVYRAARLGFAVIFRR